MGFLSSVGGFLGGVGNILGGVLGASSSNKANSTNKAIAQQQIQFQQDYAKNRLQWQVEDAKKAGLHPMVAAGLSPTSFSPVSANQQAVDYSWMGDLGQNLDYAATKAKTQKQQQQAQAFMQESNDLQLDSLRLDNDLKRMEIQAMQARLNNAGPAAPTSNDAPGLIGGQDGSIKIVPDEVIAPDIDNPSSTAGSHPLWTHARVGDFSLPVLSDKLADAVTENKEKNLGAELGYALSAWRGTIRRPDSGYTHEEREKLRSGNYSDYYYPFLGWRVEPTLSWSNFKRFVLGSFKKRYGNGGGATSWR